MYWLLLSFFLLFSFPSEGAMVEGTNFSFVLAAPSTDPDGDGSTQQDTYAWASGIFTSPADIDEVTEMGLYYPTVGTGNPDWNIAVYAHDAGDGEPGAVVGSSGNGALPSDAGWAVRDGLSISVSTSTSYWLGTWCAQDSGGSTNADRDTTLVAFDRHYRGGLGALPNPWGDSTGNFAGSYAIYALYTQVAEGRRIMIISGNYNPIFAYNVLGVN